MYFRITGNDLQDIIFESKLPIETREENGVSEQKYQLSHFILDGSFHSIGFEGLHISYGKAILKNDRTELMVEGDTPVIEMIFNIEGDRSATFAENKRNITILSQEHNIFYLPPFKGSLFLDQKKHCPGQTLKVLLTEEYFKRLANQGSPVISRMSEMMEKGRMAQMGERSLRMTAMMNLIIYEITHCDRHGIYKRLLLESKVLELLMLQVEQFEEAFYPKGASALKPGDIEKLYAVKSILENNIASSCTLWELAQQVGLNDFKLKKGFKALFGTTVFSYLHSLRMNRAKRLLMDANNTVYEVSNEVGYNYPHHFTAAFKKEFGILPSELRK